MSIPFTNNFKFNESDILINDIHNVFIKNK